MRRPCSFPKTRPLEFPNGLAIVGAQIWYRNKHRPSSRRPVRAPRRGSNVASSIKIGFCVRRYATVGRQSHSRPYDRIGTDGAPRSTAIGTSRLQGVATRRD
jgi:hypothetical protein